jgi:membrane protein
MGVSTTPSADRASGRSPDAHRHRPADNRVVAGRSLRHLARRSGLHQLRERSREVELMHRAMGFAALALVTMVPLLIVVASAAPIGGRGFAQWMIDGMGLHGEPANAVVKLFSAPRRVLSTTSVFSLVAVGLFGVTFASSVQTGYEKIWRVSGRALERVGRQVVWLVILTGYLFCVAESVEVLRGGGVVMVLRIVLILLGGVAFFWAGQYLLLGGRTGWLRLLPSAVLTMGGLVGLRMFSSWVFAPLIITNAVTYGTVGTVLIVQSWLIGAGFVVYGAALLGQHAHDMRTNGGPPPDDTT